MTSRESILILTINMSFLTENYNRAFFTHMVTMSRREKEEERQKGMEMHRQFQSLNTLRMSSLMELKAS